MKILFICKKRIDDYGKTIGLVNSSIFLADMLQDNGIKAKTVSVIDNNHIDREVFLYKPTHVIIEALWVVPEKLQILFKLHPSVKWIVRVHSKIPFLANEGIAIQWIKEYVKLSQEYPNFKIAFNNEQTAADFESIYGKSITYLPNVYYIEPYAPSTKIHSDEFVDVGCFGAIRPMKNQLLQAFAAFKFASILGKKLRFHINETRQEQGGANILKNLYALFEGTPNVLIGHHWEPHEKFLDLIKEMDIGLQMSFSESFNIVAADFTTVEVPIVVSRDINWASSFYKADFNSVNDIVKKMLFAYKAANFKIHLLNNMGLDKHNKKAFKEWLKFIAL